MEVRFQSHAGSIEAHEDLQGLVARPRFQSHAGSIEATHVLIAINPADNVSIPRWFD